MSNKVVTISQKRPEQALEHLCRHTGLGFHNMPESLVNQAANNVAQATTSTCNTDNITLKIAQQQVG